jgi:glycerophosphoryl diester phosphodiesterase
MRKRKIFLHRQVVKILALFLFLFASAGCQIADRTVPKLEPEQLEKRIYVIGHRGSAGLAPENTLAAFSRAAEIGVDGVELDVLITSDGEIIVHHDFHLRPEIARTPEGKWLEPWERSAIRKLTFAELKTYDVGRLKPYTKYAQRYPEQKPEDGERIPTLREVISLLKGYNKGTQLWIEIKTSPEMPDMTPSPESVADAVVQLLNQENMVDRARILSFDWRSLVYIQKIASDIPTIYLSHIGSRLNNIKPGEPGPSPWTAGIDVDDFNGSIPRAIKAVRGRYWAPQYRYLTPERVQEAHSLGIKVFVWTPDSRNDMQRLIEMGVDGIITNRPDILLSILGTL